MTLLSAILIAGTAWAGQAPATAPAAALAEITPDRPALFDLEESALRLIGCGLANDRFVQGQIVTVTLYLECLAGAVQPLRRDLMLTLSGVDVSRFPVTTEGKQPGEDFTVKQDVYVPRCAKPGSGALSVALVHENAPGEGRRGLTNPMAELAQVEVVSSPPPTSGTPAADIAADTARNLIANGGFENGFDAWVVAEDLRTGTFGWPRVLSLRRDDAVAREGRYALCIAFGGGQDPDFYHVSQIVPVKPSAKYRLVYWVKTEAVQSKSLPLVAVGDADRAPAAFYAAPEAAALASGTTDWSRVSFDFATPDVTRRLIVRVSRSGSGPETYDPERFGPVRGTVWFDDIRLSEVQDAAAP